MNQIATNTAKLNASKREASRQQIIEAARTLANELSYPSITMTTVADRANISRATLYRYYSTKEQLYSDVTIKWGIQFVDQMRQNPPTGATTGDRLQDVIRRTIEVSGENPRLIGAYIATMISDDFSLQSDQRRLKDLMPSMIKIAMINTEPDKLKLTSATLQHVLISNLILLNAGKTTKEMIIKEMVEIASSLLADIWDKA